MLRRLLVALVVIAGSMPVQGASAPLSVVTVTGPECSPGLKRQPAGPFGVMVFCEDALGTHIGVIHVDPLGIPVHGAWSLSNRFWQQPDWAAGVTEFAWEPAGRLLFVSTSAINGVGAVYRLDLAARRHTKLFPLPAHAAHVAKLTGGICMTHLVAIDPRTRHLTVRATDCGLATTVEVDVGY